MKYISDNKFVFGKYKDKDLHEVLKENKSYIKWCIYNIDGFKSELPEDVLEEMNRKHHQESYGLESRASGWLISWLF